MSPLLLEVLEGEEGVTEVGRNVLLEGKGRGEVRRGIGGMRGGMVGIGLGF